MLAYNITNDILTLQFRVPNYKFEEGIKEYHD